MVAAIRQTVTVGPGGRVEVRSPELKEGERADVIVLVGDGSSVESRLAALDQLQSSLKLDEAAAREPGGLFDCGDKPTPGRVGGERQCG